MTSQNIIKIQYYQSPLGEMVLGDFKGQLCLCDWRFRKMRTMVDERIKTGLQADFEISTSTLLDKTQRQLEAYFSGDNVSFELPLLFVGTSFQKQVWQALQTIAYGATQTYLGLALSIDNPKAIRAVASANGANALAIIIPCHRIIGSNQDLVGYAGGLGVKKKLLQLEQQRNQLELDF